MNTNEVGERLVALCREGKNVDAVDELYGADIESVEAMESPDMPRVMKGIDAVRGKNVWWVDNHEIHSASAHGPYPNGDKFAVRFEYDVTPTSGPYSGQRMQMDEVAVYDVKNGKIAREEFFYKMG